MKSAVFPAKLCIAVGLLVAVPAYADYSCPATTDTYNENLYLYGFNTADLSCGCHVYLGNIDFYGSNIIAACVECYGTCLYQNGYAVTDHNDNLLAWLPKNTNHVCSLNGSAGTDIDVVYSNQTLCGVTFYPLAYNSKTLAIYTGDGGDHIHGGTGQDKLYAGSGSDDVDEAGYGGVCAYGEDWGEDGDDFLYGGCGNSYLVAGAGDDEISDTGGSSDYLYGQDGSECCMRDSNDTWNVMNGGNGSDQCGSSGATSCTYNSTCDNYLQCCAMCVW